jgi:hypothetical protein
MSHSQQSRSSKQAETASANDDGPVDVSPLLALLNQLESWLREIDREDGLKRQKDDANYNGRTAALLMLRVLSDFLEAVGIRQPVTLKHVAMALCELDEGHVYPLVTPPKIAHRKPDSAFVQNCKAAAAAAMQLFMAAPELSKDQAASKVARALLKTAFRKYGGKPIDAGMIASWRDRYIGFPSEADRDAADTFQTLVATARDKFATPKRQAEGVLKTLGKSPKSK